MSAKKKKRNQAKRSSSKGIQSVEQSTSNKKKSHKTSVSKVLTNSTSASTKSTGKAFHLDL